MAIAPYAIDEDFQQIADALATAADAKSWSVLALELEQRVDAFKKLLDRPTKNEGSRSRVKNGKVELVDGQEFQLNEVFIQEAIQIADDLDLDEMEAARLLHRGTAESESLDRTPFQSAIFLYHTRRKNILDCIRLIFVNILGESADEDMRSKLATVVDALISTSATESTFSARCLSSMTQIRQSVQQLKDKERHNQTLGMETQSGEKENMELQLRFLRNQHEVLACIMVHLIKYKPMPLGDFKALLNTAKGSHTYDIFTAHYIFPLFAHISKFCGPDSTLTLEETVVLHKEMLEDYKRSPWPLRYAQAAVMIWWLSEFNGVCNDPPSTDAPSLSKLDYITDILLPSKDALRDGAFEFFLATSADINPDYLLNSAKADLHRFLQGRVPPLDKALMTLDDFRGVLIAQFETFIETFVSNMADVLKEMRTREEEDALLGQRAVDFELERFFLMVHYVYQGRRDAGLPFWTDPESNLHGFLVWASTRQTPFVEATFSYMLAALAYGDECAEHTHRFLLDEVTPGIARSRRGVYLSWERIFGHLTSYTETPKQQNPLVPVPLRPVSNTPADISGPTPESSMVLDGHLRLMAQIARDSLQARDFLVHGAANFRVASLFDILNPRIPLSLQLWDSVFYTIAAILTDKSEPLNNETWERLDTCVMKIPPPTNAVQAATTVRQGGQATSEVFESIVSAPHPAEAFVNLLTALVSLPTETADSKDALAFPETLGSSLRTSGIEPYADFVLGVIFTNTSAQNLPPDLPVLPDGQETVEDKIRRIQYRNLRPALQLSCLNFIYTCLSTLNDELFELVERNVPVDDSMRSSSMKAYAKLHPFGRVMEHLLTERCINVLFEILQLGAEHLVSGIDTPPPVVQTVIKTIQILDLALQLQPTFHAVCRIRSDEDDLIKSIVPSNRFADLQDAMLYRLETIIYLGLYVGADDAEVVFSALDLLEKLSIIPKLVKATDTVLGRPLLRNRILGKLEESPETRRIIFNFINRWEASPDNTGLGTAFPFKIPILKLLESSLQAQPNEYTLAHMLLGFGYDSKEGISLSVLPGGVGSGVSLLHCVLETAQTTSEMDEKVLEYELETCKLKNACYSVLHHLWSSPSTSSETLYVLRANRFLFNGFLEENTLHQSALWNGAPMDSAEFWTAGTMALCYFLRRRTSFFEYTALEIRQLTVQGASTMVSRYLSTLLGSTITSEGQSRNVHVLDLVDFLEVDFPEHVPAPRLSYFKDISLSGFQFDSIGIPLIEIEKVHQLLILRKNVLLRSGEVGPESTDALVLELDTLLSYMNDENNLRLCKVARWQCLRAWCSLVIVMLENCEMERAPRTTFVLQTLQTILPKLELYTSQDPTSAEELSSLACSLVSHIKFDTSTFGQGRASDVANDRLYQLFRISLRCIQSPLASTRIREDFYSVAVRYLKGMSDIAGEGKAVAKHSTQTVKASGDRLLEVICNDAYSAEGTCKIIALLLLESLVELTTGEGSTYVIDALVRQNFLVLLIDSIKTIGSDWSDSRSEDILVLLKAFQAVTGFVLRISHTRVGAAHVINAGLFQALRECVLFSVDPDIGLEFNGGTALKLEEYYGMLLDITRVIASCILSRGPQNQQAINHGRQFLIENRNLAVTVFKRLANIGGPRSGQVKNLQELGDAFILLFSLTNFVEAEENRV